MHHFHHIGKRWRVAHAGRQQLCFAGVQQPVLYQFFWTRSQRFATHRTAAHDLHKVAQHLTVIDDRTKHLGTHGHVFLGQHGQQQSRHVFHVRLFAGKQSGFGDEFGRQILGQFQHFAQLVFSAGVVSVVQATCCGKLRQLGLWAQLVSNPTGFVVSIGLVGTALGK